MRRITRLTAVLPLCLNLTISAVAFAGGGPLGIDHRVNLDEQGIWKRSNQRGLEALAIGVPIAGALWEGSDSRLGKTYWQATDSLLLGGAGYLVLNNTFRRLRPSQTDSPNDWFKSGGHSFPSGEVTAVSSAVTPFVLEYGKDDHAAYALELLPLYDAVARVKSQGHWQSDVLTGWVLGTAVGYYAHTRDTPLTVQILPRGLTVGWSRQF
ncbi:phosphatase PAP2 family protein [Oxalobacteraceae bacterium OM1]|nr:phosphatase PAP2 family protein [Oxalobacteraceae bacterium OM1]